MWYVVRTQRNPARLRLKPHGCADRKADSFGGCQSPNETGLGAIAVRANVALSSGEQEIGTRLSFGDCCRDRAQRMKQPYSSSFSNAPCAGLRSAFPCLRSSGTNTASASLNTAVT